MQSTDSLPVSIALASDPPDEIDPPDPEPASETDVPPLLVPELELIPEEAAPEPPVWPPPPPEAAVAQATFASQITLGKPQRRNVGILLGGQVRLVGQEALRALVTMVWSTFCVRSAQESAAQTQCMTW